MKGLDMSDTNLARAAGALLICFPFIWLGNAITSVQTCDFSLMTSSCGSGGSGLSNAKNVSQMVQVIPCSIGSIYAAAQVELLGGSQGPAAQWGLASNQAPFYPECISQRCTPDQCIQLSESCNSPGSPSFSCVPSAPTTDIRPLAPFLYVPMIVVGCVLLLGVVLKIDNSILVVGLLVVCLGLHFVEASIEIRRGCDYTKDTASCGAPGVGSTSVSVQADSSFSFAVNEKPIDVAFSFPSPLSPFSSNYPRSTAALALDCAVGQCVEVSTDCSSDAKTGKCVAGGSSTFTRPVDLFFGLAIVVFGVLLAVTAKLGLLGAGRGDGSDYGEHTGLLQSTV
jgi:hypothetical protein